MTLSRCAWYIALAAVGWPGIGHSQPIISPPAPDVLLSTQFRTPLTYEAALARLDEYYDQQVGRKSAAAFPQIAPNRHFDLWHDMWVMFEPGDGGTKVTIKRPADNATGRLLVKSWILNLAGRMEAPLPLAFKEEPPLHSVESELYASHRDLARLLQSESSMKPLPTWEHAGLVVSASPMISVILERAGHHGVRHLTVTAETAAAAKQLSNRLLQGVMKPGIYAAYSEEVEIGEEIRNTAKGKADTAGITSAQALYIPQMDPKLIEGKLRADPEMHKRVLAAQGQYAIRFRIDGAYRKVAVTWTELSGYSRSDGKYQGERPLGQGMVAAPKTTPQTASHLMAHAKLENLKPGAYRVSLAGENSNGELLKIDERTYWFDGKSFEEL